MAKKIRFGKAQMTLPRSRFLRVTIGVALILGGIVGFLPVVGYWMIPLGFLVLSVDVPSVRRWRLRLAAWWRGDKGGTDDG